MSILLLVILIGFLKWRIVLIKMYIEMIIRMILLYNVVNILICLYLYVFVVVVVFFLSLNVSKFKVKDIVLFSICFVLDSSVKLFVIKLLIIFVIIKFVVSRKVISNVFLFFEWLWLCECFIFIFF